MTTLITVSTSEGVVGRCDARCHNALGPRCKCVCRGENHGVGGEAALENTRLIYDDLAEFTETRGGLHLGRPEQIELGEGSCLPPTSGTAQRNGAPTPPHSPTLELWKGVGFG